MAVKFGSAYRRRLNFQQPDEQKAALEFSQVLSIREMGDDRFLGRHEPSLPMEQVLALDDWMTHRMLFLCAKYRLPAVFHVALHAFNENNIDRCHAQDLNDLVASHPDTRFLILHCGMPFVEEAVTLARYFPNVWLDFTWAHTISPSITQRLIKMVLELVPIHKVLAFGGDLCHLQTIYGYLEVAMENLAQVFQEEIALGHMEEQQAKDILKKWFYDNPSAFYGLNLPPVH